jgi:hypothetical protein
LLTRKAYVATCGLAKHGDLVKILQKTRLEATSPKNAWYELELVELLEGFSVIKRSGQQAAKGIEDAWFRRTLDSAEKKYLYTIKQKTSRTTGRQYKEVTPAKPQLDLW